MITEEQAKLAAAAPALARALLAVEWEGVRVEELAGGEAFNDWACPACSGRKDGAHDADCQLDAALALAGLPDQASRDAARAAIGGRK